MSGSYRKPLASPTSVKECHGVEMTGSRILSCCHKYNKVLIPPSTTNIISVHLRHPIYLRDTIPCLYLCVSRLRRPSITLTTRRVNPKIGYHLQVNAISSMRQLNPLVKYSPQEEVGLSFATDLDKRDLCPSHAPLPSQLPPCATSFSTICVWFGKEHHRLPTTSSSNVGRLGRLLYAW